MSATTAVRSAVDGVHYVVTGDGPRTVVLLHGFSDNLTTWTRVVPPLAATHRVIAIDLPGFGRSTRRWTTPLCAGYVDVVREVLDAEGVTEPVVLMGNSMGAVVSSLFAARHPRRTDSVVLIDMPGLRSVPRLWGLAMSQPAEWGLRTATRLLPAGVARTGLSVAYGFVAAARPTALDPSVRQGFGSPYATRGSVASILPIGRALLDELRRADLARVVGGLSAPVLMVFGSRDVLTPARVLRRIDAAGGAVVLPGCGHCPQIDRPGALMEQVGKFLGAAQGLLEAASA